MNTPRRRFFPSTRAQQLPARSVELEMQLRPLAPPAAQNNGPGPAAESAPWVSWLAPLRWDWGPYSDDYKAERQPDGRLRIEDPIYGLDYSLWEGEPVLDLNGKPAVVPGVGFVCRDLQVTSSGPDSYGGQLFFGVALGPLPETITWEVSWHNPGAGDVPRLASGMSPLGHHASGFGNVLVVRVIETGGGGDSINMLTATASSPSGEVGKLRLGLRAVAY